MASKYNDRRREKATPVTDLVKLGSWLERLTRAYGPHPVGAHFVRPNRLRRLVIPRFARHPFGAPSASKSAGLPICRTPDRPVRSQVASR